MRKLFFMIFFLWSTFASASVCNVNLPLGIPTVKDQVKVICKTGFITAYDTSAKIPSWVAYNVRPDNAIGCTTRTNRFYVEQGVPVIFRSRTTDYRNSGYDIGHMADAASMSHDPKAELDSFTLSNAAPQDPSMNRGIWSNLELRIRVFAFNGRSLTVYTGGIYSANSKKIGEGVVVPDKFFKIIVDNKTNESLAFIIDNNNDLKRSLNSSIVSIAEVEHQSGLVFPITGDKQAVNKLWSYDARSLREAKQAKCSAN